MTIEHSDVNIIIIKKPIIKKNVGIDFLGSRQLPSAFYCATKAEK